LVRISDPDGRRYTRYLYLVDGRTVADRDSGVKPDGDTFAFNTTALADGKHVLRAVAYSTGAVRRQVFAESSFVAMNSKP